MLGFSSTTSIHGVAVLRSLNTGNQITHCTIWWFKLVTHDLMPHNCPTVWNICKFFKHLKHTCALQFGGWDQSQCLTWDSFLFPFCQRDKDFVGFCVISNPSDYRNLLWLNTGGKVGSEFIKNCTFTLLWTVCNIQNISQLNSNRMIRTDLTLFGLSWVICEVCSSIHSKTTFNIRWFPQSYNWWRWNKRIET